MEPTEEEMQKARKVQILLVVLMALLIFAPILVFILRR